MKTKLKVRYPSNKKILIVFLLVGGVSLILGLLSGNTNYSMIIFFSIFLASLFALPTTIIVLLVQKTFIFDSKTRQITIGRTVGWKRIVLDNSKKEYMLVLKKISVTAVRGNLLVLVLQKNKKTIYKIAEGLSEKQLVSLAKKIQNFTNCSFHNKSQKISSDVNFTIEEIW